MLTIFEKQERLSMTTGLYNIDEFKDNCGFGLIAHLKGKASHRLLEMAIESLTCMTHRGGIAADGKTGDGCGLLIQKPDAFFRAAIRNDFGIELSERYGVGSIMLSKDAKRADKAKAIFTAEMAAEGLDVVAWRTVPTNSECLGPIALASQPDFVQVLLIQIPLILKS
jgi:glutamate synthase (NADPH/NADH) large chain